MQVDSLGRKRRQPSMQLTLAEPQRVPWPWDDRGRSRVTADEVAADIARVRQMLIDLFGQVAVPLFKLS